MTQNKLNKLKTHKLSWIDSKQVLESDLDENWTKKTQKLKMDRFWRIETKLTQIRTNGVFGRILTFTWLKTLIELNLNRF